MVERKKSITIFVNKELIRLKSLTIEIYEREIWPSCIDFLKYHSIEYLSLRCIPNQVLIEAILSSSILYSFFTFSKLRKIKLFWLRRSMRPDYFERLLAVTPIIKYIYLDLVKIPFIKIFIRCRELARTNNNNEKIMFDKYCRQILSIMNTQTNTYFKVKWIEEDSKMHRIQMIIHNIGLYLDFR
ncbi:unnamed protein product [Rotaria sordida]|uniref:Uncharacterized protein n=1 Tax=Rotaria sordida TaxID=392033 RepID=A0A818P284_9BILA|nr:unnamed protein product [Rotaria sordida]